MKPVVWSIAGHDPTGGAGITLDNNVFHALGVHGCTFQTCDTVQTTQGVKEVKGVDPAWVTAQIKALQQDLPPRVIKLGALSVPVMETVLHCCQTAPYIICDTVLAASSSQPFLPAEDYRVLLPHIDLLTPNWPEASQLSGIDIVDHDDVPKAADTLHAQGVKAVLITGGHGPGDTVAEYFSDGHTAFWLTLPRLPNANVHGTGCALSSAIAAMVAQDHDLKDAVVIAKMVLHQAIEQAQHLGQGASLFTEFSLPPKQAYLPGLSRSGKWLSAFPACGDLGLYVIVDSVAWIERLLKLNVKTLQLRIKNATQTELVQQIEQSVALCEQYGAKLFINDYWQFAIKHGAYGVHLGQEDLDTAGLKAIQQAGLRLGISTHCFYEVARAHAYRPSYMAYGPIYHTDSKPMAFGPRGLEQLAYWQQTLDYPLVAIGGINHQRLADVLATGIKSVAVISEITQAEDVEAAVKTMQVEGNGHVDP